MRRRIFFTQKQLYKRIKEVFYSASNDTKSLGCVNGRKTVENYLKTVKNN